MKAVMYHYVRPFDPSMPFLKHLHMDDFRRQLDHFEQHGGFVSKEQLQEALVTKQPVQGHILTFDDGLKCHYKHVYPELKQRGLWGIFYVPTKMYSSNKILDVHRIHILLGIRSSKDIYDELMSIIKEDWLADASRREFRELTYITQSNDRYTDMVKRILNYFISYAFREQVIDQLMEKFVPEQVNTVSNFYVTKNEIKEMHDDGMVIGSHTVSHAVLSKLNGQEQLMEINGSFNFIQKTCGSFPFKTFCYPYGGFHSFDAGTETLLHNEGCHFSFNVEHRDIAMEDLAHRPQALPRYDCNQFPYGQVRL